MDRNQRSRRQKSANGSYAHQPRRSMGSRLGLEKRNAPRPKAPPEKAAPTPHAPPRQRPAQEINPQKAGYRSGTPRRTRRVTQAEIIRAKRHAFDKGITHFDLANNYGHPARGLAEENFGKALRDCLGAYRDELIISTKAGYDMWPGPYGNWGSRKYLFASLDQSLLRMGLDYVDIYYHHRPDPETPLEETMGALSDLVRSGKALYVGISNYKEEETREAVWILKENGTPCLIHQVRYNMFERWPEDGLFSALSEHGVGCICYSPLAQGALTEKYLNGVPAGSRASRAGTTVAERYLSGRAVTSVPSRSEPVTGTPFDSSSSASEFMDTPPMPIRWMVSLFSI